MCVANGSRESEATPVASRMGESPCAVRSGNRGESVRLGLSVVVPVFDEASALPEFVPALLRVLRDAVSPESWEVILVDDGSDERTSALLREYVEPDRVLMLRHEHRLGSGAARKTGTARARGEWVVWIDADGTYDPGELLRLLSSGDGADQVIGVRDAEHGPWRMLRRGVKQAARLLAAGLMRAPIADLNSGFRILRRECLLVWLAELPDGFSCTSTATLAALRRRQRVRFVPITYRSRLPGSRSKFHPVFDTIRLFRVILRYGLSSPPGA